MLVVGSQIALAWGVLRRSSGAVPGLVLCEVTTFVASVAGGLGAGAGRPGHAIGAVVVLALLSVSLRTFPLPQWPRMSR